MPDTNLWETNIFFSSCEWWNRFGFLWPTKKQINRKTVENLKLNAPAFSKCVRKTTRPIRKLNNFRHGTCSKRERRRKQLVTSKPHQLFQLWDQMMSNSKVFTQTTSWGSLLSRPIKTPSLMCSHNCSYRLFQSLRVSSSHAKSPTHRSSLQELIWSACPSM